jgi:hypothetical protein
MHVICWPSRPPSQFIVFVLFLLSFSFHFYYYRKNKNEIKMIHTEGLFLCAREMS